MFDPEILARDREAGLRDIRPYTMMIQDVVIRLFTEKCLEAAPAYFWHIPASSSGKYHPDWAVTESGLLKHTVFAMYLGYELCGTFGLAPDDRDKVVAALALHDTLKYGIDYDQRYYEMHPYMPRVYFGSGKGGLGLNKFLEHEYVFDDIMKAVECHMGNLREGTWNSVGLTPCGGIQQVVHLADYLASRKKVCFQDFLPEGC